MNVIENIYTVINEAYPALRILQDDFYIIGASALILSGVKIKKTFDIDILTSNRDADFLRRAWDEKLIKEYIPERSDLFRSNFSRYNFGALDIEILGNLEVHKNNHWKQLIIQDYTTISKNEVQLKLPTLKEQERILKWFGREKDILKLKLIDSKK